MPVYASWCDNKPDCDLVCLEHWHLALRCADWVELLLLTVATKKNDDAIGYLLFSMLKDIVVVSH